MWEKLKINNAVDLIVSVSLGVALVTSIFYGSHELSINIASGLVGYMGKSVITHKGENEK